MKVIDLLWTHLGAIAGFGLAVFVVLKLLRQRHRPSVTFSWLLGMAVLPWVVAPLYLLLGGRKLRRAVARATELAAPRRESAEAEASAVDPPTSGLQRLLARDGLPPAREGNDFEFLGDGELAHDRLTEMLAGARSSIHVTTFILARDDVARHFVELLAQKAAEGIEVRLLVDALGSFLSRGRFLDPLRAAGGQVASFMPMLPLSRRHSANLRNHRKLVVVDGESAWVAGMNLAGEYLGSSPLSGVGSGGARTGARDASHLWLDTAAVLRGPVAADVEAVFASDWTFATGEELAPPPEPAPLPDGDVVAQVVPSGPDVPSDGVADVVLSGIADARRRIWLVTPYFVPDDTLLRSLTLQARMGRDVRLTVPARSDHVLVDLARCRFLRELLAAGATVRTVPGRMVHAKLAVFDDDLAVMGSANLDLRSLYLNFEISVLLHSRDAVADVVDWMEELDALAQDHVPPEPGLLRTWTEDLAVLISPLL